MIPREPLRREFVTLTLVGSFFHIAGCYLPSTGINMLEGGRYQVHPERFGRITPGATSRREVLLALGEPDRVWDSEACIVYRTDELKGTVFEPVTTTLALSAALVSGMSASPILFDVGRHRLWLIQFDQTGIVVRIEELGRPLNESADRLGEVCEQWSAGGDDRTAGDGGSG